ncbi:extracellular solute-binding protein [Kutzneria sp. NPDC051319]|uniref:extracellular solute-binding protein n=1 Tax=Kutzneria sp. NPDC051319 TaxID=3155047 RepID=UPI00343A4785
MRKLALVAAAVLLAAAGCGGQSAVDESTLTEMDYYNTDPALTALPQLLDTCGQQAGVTIKRQVVPDLRTKVLQLVGSHQVPDLVLLDNPDLQQIAATGALAPLDLPTDGLYPNVVEAGRYQGKLYGVAPGVMPSRCTTTPSSSRRPVSRRPGPGTSSRPRPLG